MTELISRDRAVGQVLFFLFQISLEAMFVASYSREKMYALKFGRKLKFDLKNWAFKRCHRYVKLYR